MIPVYKPYFPEGSLERAHKALASGWVSSRGPYVEEVEERLRGLLARKHVVLTSSGTAAMKLCTHALFWKFPHVKTVVAPNNCYVAAWNAFLLARRDTELRFIRTSLETWNTDHVDLEYSLKPDHALLVVHNLGGVVNVPKVRQKIREHAWNIPIIEDNCEGLLGRYAGRATGTDCFASAVSFYGNKTITSGEGGAFATDDDEAHHYARLFTGQGHGRDFIHTMLGDNFRMTNVAAAILLGQIDHLDDIRHRKACIFKRYSESLSDIGKLQANEPDTEHAQWMFGIRIPNLVFDDTKKALAECGIETRPMFTMANAHIYKIGETISDTNAYLLRRECVILPSYPELTEIEQGRIIDAVRTYAKTVRK